ncbi:MAG: RNA-binding protein [Caulobacteraceae bacterium]|nr:RNA-binding protein [Caulobacteraceae bacterium]
MEIATSEPDTLPQPATLAETSRQRRDLVSGQVMEEARLVRFVAGPDGVVFPDVARKLPGRGLWVAADRASVDTAVRKGGFSRAAKTRLNAPADLADQVEALLRARILNSLGLARRSGALISGFEGVSTAIATGKAVWLIEASDGAEDGRRKLRQVARRLPVPPRMLGVFNSEELSLALGLGNVIHLAFLAGRSAKSWAEDVERLSGFRPLLPESWREEP